MFLWLLDFATLRDRPKNRIALLAEDNFERNRRVRIAQQGLRAFGDTTVSPKTYWTGTSLLVSRLQQVLGQVTAAGSFEKRWQGSL